MHFQILKVLLDKVDIPAYKDTAVHPSPDFPPAHLNHSTLVVTVVCFQRSLIESFEIL